MGRSGVGGHALDRRPGYQCTDAGLLYVDGLGLPLPILSLKGSPETHLTTPPASCLISRGEWQLQLSDHLSTLIM